jgi:hypothetical protein
VITPPPRNADRLKDGERFFDFDFSYKKEYPEPMVILKNQRTHPTLLVESPCVVW